MNKYFIMKEYQKGADYHEPTLSYLNEKELFSLLHNEGSKKPEDRRKFAIFTLGDCLIDWS